MNVEEVLRRAACGCGAMNENEKMLDKARKLE
jgi:hypothetical protein